MDATPESEFVARVERHRRELLVHCYRMLGSVHDAQDLVQETVTRAWRAHEGYDPSKASMRTWLYRIATNACLTALGTHARRPLPSGVGAPFDDPEAPFVPGFEVPWLEPMPDAVITGDRDNPELSAVERSRLRLARHDFVDEYRLLVFPTVLGDGTPLFERGAGPMHLRLVSAEASGPAVLLRYERCVPDTNGDARRAQDVVAPVPEMRSER